MIKAFMNYGPIVSGVSYKIQNEGKDWLQVSSMGKPIYVPKWVFGLMDGNLN